MLSIEALTILLLFFIFSVKGQINFGTVNLGRNSQTGDVEFGFNQFANLFSFGGDNGFKVNAGDGRFGLTGNQGGLIGGERIGTNSGINVDQNRGLNLGSMLNFGNQPVNPLDPAGQLNTFINNIGHFFQKLSPPPVTPVILPGTNRNSISGISQITTEKSLTVPPELGKKFDEEDKENIKMFPTLVPEIIGDKTTIKTITTTNNDYDTLIDGENISSSIKSNLNNNNESEDKDLIQTSSNIDTSVEVIEKPVKSLKRNKKRRGPPAPEGMAFIDDKDSLTRRKMF
ncbi:Hypothetical protein SRAE_X000107600 [Strongyloides ratti]|uniref:Uncharacterized protein n=1 Tax=Strongyloides ratti TaxID=34506 RepID=A0A090MMS6_STRRB|nr:Hypothetical protein SRAE_X000107600 [Strongyloides ratti]CEF59326.1 Hypothetical protein SRAE_X000107600 [Strongyloides ratti]